MTTGARRVRTRFITGGSASAVSFGAGSLSAPCGATVTWGADGWYYPHGYYSRPWMGLHGFTPVTRATRSRASAMLAVVQPGPEGLAVKSRGAELAVRRFDHDRRTGSEGVSTPSTDERARRQD